ncbi:MAG: 2-isopropylmalate synthase [Thiotrichales bacterium]|nr:2-isopropylmalate synthase [Thiotrichales bacterium]OUX52934.1 MAG: 2-isopropylmalate synthase [Methylococcaceae bacterium TMED282]
MSNFNHSKYMPYPLVGLKDRTWPDQEIKKAPLWCSVDLRDGNQALIEPMNVSQKLQMFKLLVKVGFKEIEVGFPAASQPDFDFVRTLVEENLIPDDVTVQVLTQAREELIVRSFESLSGAKNAIMHLYNSTSTVQRDKVFELDRDGIKNIAVEGAKVVLSESKKYRDTKWRFEYSPESFTGTELDYAVEVCDAVLDVWNASEENPCVINLPATVEMATPNIYADQIEWMSRNLARRAGVVLSLHTHNDRGCAVAAAELGVMAGADRIEGTLLGNGERTGNMDIVTMAMNLYSQGIEPELDLSNMDEIIRCVKACTQLPVHPRHPYAGELVFTAFSGSHQDAIKKCLTKRQPDDKWAVAYLPIDPSDLGRSYQEVIRINSQSGKGGVAYVLEQERGLNIPRWLQIDFSSVVQKYAEDSEAEVAPGKIVELFTQHYLDMNKPYELKNYQLSRIDGEDHLTAEVLFEEKLVELSGRSAGVVSAFVSALEDHAAKQIVLVEYSEHTLSQADGADAEAVTYVQLSIEGTRYCGVGLSNDILEASLKAILGAINCSTKPGKEIAA